MQRDMDLVRLILLDVERHEDPVRFFRVDVPGYSPEYIAHHVKLLAEAGYLEAENLSTLSSFDWQPKALTWTGHEFLDSIRHGKVWQKLKAELKDKGISLPFSLIQQLALKIAASYFGLSGK